MLYAGLLQREPETTGFNYWVGRLQAGMTRREVLTALMISPEYRVSAAVPAVK